MRGTDQPFNSDFITITIIKSINNDKLQEAKQLLRKLSRVDTSLQSGLDWLVAQECGEVTTHFRIVDFLAVRLKEMKEMKEVEEEDGRIQIPRGECHKRISQMEKKKD